MKDHPFIPAPQENAAKDVHFHEEDMPVKLSARDAAKLAEGLEKPPAPKQSARRAAKRFRREYGGVED